MKFPVAAGIAARMGSTRLPGKCMAEIEGRPMLRHIVDRARRCDNVDAVYVLTSRTPLDDRIATYCDENKIPCLRGSERDVLSRYIDLAQRHDSDYIVRITGDCPLIEPSFIDYQIERLWAEGADLVLLPDSVEGTLGGQGVMSRFALEKAANTQDPMNAEHVGAFLFAEKAHMFRHVWLDPQPVYSSIPKLRLCVDEQRDLDMIRAIFKRMPDYFSTSEVIRWLKNHPEVRMMNMDVQNSEANKQVRRLKRK